MELMVLRLVHRIRWKSRTDGSGRLFQMRASAVVGMEAKEEAPVTGVLLCLDVTERVYDMSLV